MTAPTPERRVGEARVAELAKEHPGHIGLATIRDLALDLLDERAANARLTAEVERLRGIAHRAIDILDGMERRTMDIDPETGEFDDAVDVLRTALDRAALSLPTPAPEATEEERNFAARQPFLGCRKDTREGTDAS